MKFKTFIGHAPVLLLAGAGFPSASVAAPSIKTVAVSGSIANACSLSTTSVSVDLKITGTTKFTPTPASVAAACNSPSGGTLSVSATNATKSVGGAGTAVYTFTVSGWGTAGPVTSGAALATTFTTSTYTSVNVTFPLFTTTTTTTGNYTGTITLGLAPRP